MLAYLIRRIGGTIPVLVLVSIFVFGFVHALPGDPARLEAGPEASPADIEAIRRDMGLDGPVWMQYVRWADNTLHGRLGRSTKTRQPVATVIGERFMPTLWLTVVAMAWSTVVGIGIGVFSGIRRGRWQDRAGMVLAISGVSFPGFWLGLLMIDLFSVRLGWLPTSGYGTWQHFVMPSFCLGVGVAAVMARFTRSAFVEVSQEDYVRTARMKGVSDRSVAWKHTLRNALIPVITLTGLQFGFLLGGAIVIETVFSWPGLGRMLVDAVGGSDYPLAQGAFLLIAAVLVFMNFVADLLYGLLDPRVAHGRR
jgi:glutathione transport system permease protein